MGLSKIEICNHALLKVGADTIASLDTSQSDDSGVITSAKLCKIFFSQALEETLRMYSWNSCTKRASLVQLTEKPAFKFANSFQLPTDFVRLINAYYDVNAREDRTEWALEGNKILCDSDTLFIKYVARPDDVSTLDALSTQALIGKLAIKLAVPLQLDTSMQNNIIQELEQVIMPQARSIDTIENKSWDLEESDWILSRNNR
jgi:hypothetical protein